jgi:hypothetical protein
MEKVVNNIVKVTVVLTQVGYTFVIRTPLE